jgi:hypothetical protein
MNTDTTPHTTLEEVEDLFKNWRKTRKSHKPVPRRLWEAATSLAANYPIPTIAKRLLLDPSALKRRARAERTQPADHRSTDPAFIELAIGDHGVDYECTIEMEDQIGSKMKMHVRDVRGLDLYEICRAFWNGQK